MPIQDLLGSFGDIAGEAVTNVLGSTITDAGEAIAEGADIGSIADAASNSVGQVSELQGVAEGVDLTSLAENLGTDSVLGDLGIDGLADAASNITEGGIGRLLGGLFGR